MRRSTQVIEWTETFCVVPFGGKRVRLTAEERETVRRIYADKSVDGSVPVGAPLANYLALMHTVGPEACLDGHPDLTAADVWSVWASAGPRFQFSTSPPTM